MVVNDFTILRICGLAEWLLNAHAVLRNGYELLSFPFLNLTVSRSCGMAANSSSVLAVLH